MHQHPVFAHEVAVRVRDAEVVGQRVGGVGAVGGGEVRVGDAEALARLVAREEVAHRELPRMHPAARGVVHRVVGRDAERRGAG